MEDYDGFDPQRQRTAPSMRSPDLQYYATGPHPKAQVSSSLFLFLFFSFPGPICVWQAHTMLVDCTRRDVVAGQLQLPVQRQQERSRSSTGPAQAPVVVSAATIGR